MILEDVSSPDCNLSENCHCLISAELLMDSVAVVVAAVAVLMTFLQRSADSTPPLLMAIAYVYKK